MMTNLAPPQIRATTGLELAAGVFTKCSDQLASQLNVSLTSGKRDAKQTALRIGINGDIYGGMRAPLEVGTRRVDIAYVNPAAMVAMAYRGKGYYKQKMQLRVLRLLSVLGPHRAGGVERSRREIAARYRPAKNSAARIDAIVRRQQRNLLHDLDDSFFVRVVVRQDQTLGRKSAGVRPAVFAGAAARRSPSARLTRCSTKASARRAAGWIRRSTMAMRSFPSNRRSSKSSNRWVTRRTVLPKSRYRQLKEDALTIDYSGWALVTHRWLPNNVAYAAIETIDERQKVIPVDDDQPLDMRNLCRGTEKCPLQRSAPSGRGEVL